MRTPRHRQDAPEQHTFFVAFYLFCYCLLLHVLLLLSFLFFFLEAQFTLAHILSRQLTSDGSQALSAATWRSAGPRAE